jgi:hypothetical protein
MNRKWLVGDQSVSLLLENHKLLKVHETELQRIIRTRSCRTLFKKTKKFTKKVLKFDSTRLKSFLHNGKVYRELVLENLSVEFVLEKVRLLSKIHSEFLSHFFFF